MYKFSRSSFMTGLLSPWYALAMGLACVLWGSFEPIISPDTLRSQVGGVLAAGVALVAGWVQAWPSHFVAEPPPRLQVQLLQLLSHQRQLAQAAKEVLPSIFLLYKDVLLLARYVGFQLPSAVNLSTETSHLRFYAFLFVCALMALTAAMVYFSAWVAYKAVHTYLSAPKVRCAHCTGVSHKTTSNNLLLNCLSCKHVKTRVRNRTQSVYSIQPRKLDKSRCTHDARIVQFRTILDLVIIDLDSTRVYAFSLLAGVVITFACWSLAHMHNTGLLYSIGAALVLKLNVIAYYVAGSAMRLLYAWLVAISTCIYSVASLVVSGLKSIPVMFTPAGTFMCPHHQCCTSFALNVCCHAAASAHTFFAGFIHAYTIIITLIIRVIALLLSCGMHTLGRISLTRSCICTIALALFRWACVEGLSPNSRNRKNRINLTATARHQVAGSGRPVLSSHPFPVWYCIFRQDVIRTYSYIKGVAGGNSFLIVPPLAQYEFDLTVGWVEGGLAPTPLWFPGTFGRILWSTGLPSAFASTCLVLYAKARSSVANLFVVKWGLSVFLFCQSGSAWVFSNLGLVTAHKLPGLASSVRSALLHGTHLLAGVIVVAGIACLSGASPAWSPSLTVDYAGASGPSEFWQPPSTILTINSHLKACIVPRSGAPHECNQSYGKSSPVEGLAEGLPRLGCGLGPSKGVPSAGFPETVSSMVWMYAVLFALVAVMPVLESLLEVNSVQGESAPQPATSPNTITVTKRCHEPTAEQLGLAIVPYIAPTPLRLPSPTRCSSDKSSTEQFHSAAATSSPSSFSGQGGHADTASLAQLQPSGSCYMMTGQVTAPKESIIRGLPQIAATCGIQLQHELDAWTRSAIQVHHKPNGPDEALLIEAFKGCCTAAGAVLSIVTNTTNDPSLANLAPDAYATAMAKREKAIWITHMESVRQRKVQESEYAQRIELLYPEFRVPLALTDMLNTQEDILDRINAPAAQIAGANQAIATIRAMIKDQQRIHESRELSDKYLWLKSQPLFAAQVTAYDELRKLKKELASEVGGIDLTAQANSYENYQFKSVDDFKAINWLCEYVMSKAGGITHANVEAFRNLRMEDGETPRQASARAINSCDLIVKSGHRGFNKHHELDNLFTVKHSNGNFFTTALHVYTELHIRSTAKAAGIDLNDIPAMIDLKIEIMDEQFQEAFKNDSDVGAAIKAELKARSRKKTTPPKDGDGQPRRTDLECSHHGIGNHTTKQCKFLKDQRAAGNGANGGRPKQTPLVGGLLDNTNPPAANDMAAANTDRPGARYGQQPVCDFCSKIASQEIRHPPKCFIRGDVPMPETWKPVNLALRAYVDSIRAGKTKPGGKTRLPPKAQVNVVLGSTAPLVGMLRTSYFLPGSSQPPLEPRDITAELHFSSSSLEFRCKCCQANCVNIIDAASGRLNEVHCLGCKTTWAAHILKKEWTSYALWAKDAASAGMSYSAGLPQGPYPSNRSQSSLTLAPLRGEEEPITAYSKPAVTTGIDHMLAAQQIYDSKEPVLNKNGALAVANEFAIYLVQIEVKRSGVEPHPHFMRNLLRDCDPSVQQYHREAMELIAKMARERLGISEPLQQQPPSPASGDGRSTPVYGVSTIPVSQPAALVKKQEDDPSVDPPYDPIGEQSRSEVDFQIARPSQWARQPFLGRRLPVRTAPAFSGEIKLSPRDKQPVPDPSFRPESNLSELPDPGYKYGESPAQRSTYMSAPSYSEHDQPWSSPEPSSYPSAGVSLDKGATAATGFDFAGVHHKGKIVASPLNMPAGFIMSAQDMVNLGLYDPVGRTIPSDQIIDTITAHVCEALGYNPAIEGGLKHHISGLIETKADDLLAAQPASPTLLSLNPTPPAAPMVPPKGCAWVDHGELSFIRDLILKFPEGQYHTTIPRAYAVPSLTELRSSMGTTVPVSSRLERLESHYYHMMVNRPQTNDYSLLLNHERQLLINSSRSSEDNATLIVTLREDFRKSNEKKNKLIQDLTNNLQKVSEEKDKAIKALSDKVDSLCTANKDATQLLSTRVEAIEKGKDKAITDLRKELLVAKYPPTTMSSEHDEISLLSLRVGTLEAKPIDLSSAEQRLTDIEKTSLPFLNRKINELQDDVIAPISARLDGVESINSEGVTSHNRMVNVVNDIIELTRSHGDVIQVLRKTVDDDMPHFLFHDLNYIWDQIKHLKDSVQPNWRAITGYRETTVEEVEQVAVVHHRMMTELPVIYTDDALRNYGSVQSAPQNPFPTLAERESIPDTPVRALRNTPERSEASAGVIVVRPVDRIDLASEESPREEAGGEPHIPLSSLAYRLVNTFLGNEPAGTSGQPAHEVDRRASARFTSTRPEYNDVLNGDASIKGKKTKPKPNIPEPVPLRPTKPSRPSRRPPVVGVIITSVPQNLRIDDDISRMLEDYDARDGMSTVAVITDQPVSSDATAPPQSSQADPLEVAWHDNPAADSALAEQFVNELVALTGEPVTLPSIPEAEPLAAAVTHERHPKALVQLPPRPKLPAKQVKIISPPATDSGSENGSDVSAPLSIKSPAITPITPKNADGWPSVSPVLKPRVGKDTLSQFQDGVFVPTAEQLRSHKKFFQRRATLASFSQTDDATSLTLFSVDGQSYVRPETVMDDSGAEPDILIAPYLARILGILDDLETYYLQGVCGGGSCEGRSRKRIAVRLGACIDGDDTASAFNGCFTVMLRPIVMKQEMADNLRHDVLLGQGFMRLCLGQLDPLTETFDYSPAWMTHACADFRVSIPCKMSARPSYVNALMCDDNDEEVPCLADLCGAAYRPLTALPAPNVQQPAAAPPAIPKPSAKAKKSKKSVTAARNKAVAQVTAALSPGFPQTATVPTREEFQLHRAHISGRKVEDGQSAIVPVPSNHSPDNPGNVIRPIGVTYALPDLKQSGRLMDGAMLDLSGTNLLTHADLQRQLAKFKREILAEIHAAVSLPASSSTPAVTATKPVTAQKPAPAAAQPVPAQSEFPPLSSVVDTNRRSPRLTGGIARVADTTPPQAAPVLSFARHWEVNEGYMGSKGVPLETARKQHFKAAKRSKASATAGPLTAVILAALANLPAAKAAQPELAGSSYNNLVVNTGVIASLLFAVILFVPLTANRALKPIRWVIVSLAGALALTLFSQDLAWASAVSHPMVQHALIALAMAVVFTILHVFFTLRTLHRETVVS